MKAKNDSKAVLAARLLKKARDKVAEQNGVDVDPDKLVTLDPPTSPDEPEGYLLPPAFALAFGSNRLQFLDMEIKRVKEMDPVTRDGTYPREQIAELIRLCRDLMLDKSGLMDQVKMLQHEQDVARARALLIQRIANGITIENLMGLVKEMIDG